MTEIDKLLVRLDELEMRYAFQQETLETLNEIVTDQWAQIDRLAANLNLLKDRVQQAGNDEPEDPDQRPPHY